MGKWRKDVLSILDDVAEGPQVTVLLSRMIFDLSNV